MCYRQAYGVKIEKRIIKAVYNRSVNFKSNAHVVYVLRCGFLRTLTKPFNEDYIESGHIKNESKGHWAIIATYGLKNSGLQCLLMEEGFLSNTTYINELGIMGEKEIENLCIEICSNLQDGSYTEERKSLRSLRNMCGLRTCACSMLTPSLNLSRLLKLHYHSESVLSITTGLAIISNYDSLGQEEHCNKILERILTYTISMGPSEEKNKFLRELWDYPGLKNFTITAVEDLIVYQSNFLEEDILNVFEKSINTNNESPVPKDSKYERIILWSSNSARIFCAVTSIFNALLQRTASSFGSYNIGVTVVNQFICNVKLRCKAVEKDFVLLYPFEYHSLISILDVNPNCFPESCAIKSSVNISTAVQLIELSFMRKPIQTLCLLTHFPAWLPYVNR